MMLLISFLILCISSVQNSKQSFQNFKEKMQNKTILLSEAMANIYGQRCSSGVVSCKLKSYNLCEGTSQKICYDDFPKPIECVDGGAYLSMEPTIRFPNGRDPYNLNDEQRQFVCNSAQLDPYMKEFNDRQYQYGMSYLGTFMGMMKAYPSARQINQEGGCDDYDPRFRPWYSAATSGSKNVIVLMDASGSMLGGRMDVAKLGVKTLIDTFSNDDFIAIVPFNNQAEPLVQNKITRATDVFKQELKLAVEEVFPEGETNYTKAFQNSLTLLQEAEADEYGSPCSNSKNVIIFLTDGVPTDTDYKNSTQLIDFIKQELVKKNLGDMILFTYAMEVSDPVVLLEMACQFNGLMLEILTSMDDQTVVNMIIKYYAYIAEGLNITKPVWTEPYEDFFGFGELVTVSLPVYYYEGDARKILGVVGLDVVMKTFYGFGFTKDQIIEELVHGSPCLYEFLDECEVQALRDDSAKCNLTNCSSLPTITACSSFPAYDLYFQAQDTTEDRCCGLDIGQLIGILIGCIAFLHIIAMIVYICNKQKIDRWVNEWRRKGEIKQQQKPRKEKQYM